MNDSHRSHGHPQGFDWKPQPGAAAFVTELLQAALTASPAVRRLAERMHGETGTRLADWIDHWILPDSPATVSRLLEEGYFEEKPGVWRMSSGLFPPVRLQATPGTSLVLRVESVADFLLVHRVQDSGPIAGGPTRPARRARLTDQSGVAIWVLERHGTAALEPESDQSQIPASALLEHAEALRLRRRDFDDSAEGFAHAVQLVEAAAQPLGIDRTCDLFFAAERAYWQARNRAARIQKSRQDALGLGWANHDHHTYRSSREHFAELVQFLERLGFQCRERFYAGREAGWGAQVLEQASAGIVIFADVDLSPEEVADDFSHQPLPPRETLGTVGLWCQLHGESFLEAGMHHLECQFDFDAARAQLRDCGIESMKPFTDLPYLRQAFTKGDVWPVQPGRLERLLRQGRISAEQAEVFRARGAVGSHLEILQRDDGYKGFNQSGINEIIRDTDPRTMASSA